MTDMALLDPELRSTGLTTPSRRELWGFLKQRVSKDKRSNVESKENSKKITFESKKGDDNKHNFHASLHWSHNFYLELKIWDKCGAKQMSTS